MTEEDHPASVGVDFEGIDPNEYYISERTSPGIFVFLLGAGMIAFGAYLISVFWF